MNPIYDWDFALAGFPPEERVLRHVRAIAFERRSLRENGDSCGSVILPERLALLAAEEVQPTEENDPTRLLDSMSLLNELLHQRERRI